MSAIRGRTGRKPLDGRYDNSYHGADSKTHITAAAKTWILRWAPGTKKELRGLDEDVRADFGYGLYLVQEGKQPHEIEQAVEGLKLKQLTGYGALIYELKQNFNKDTYRCVYTVRFRGVVYVLHAFKKKSKRGSALPKEDDDLIREHLKWAEAHYRKNPVEEDDDGTQVQEG